MITEFTSTSIRTSSTVQNFMNDLKDQWSGWTSVVYDSQDATQVIQLWISDNLYIDLNTSAARVEFKHSTKGAQVTLGTNYFIYNIVVTDIGLMVYCWFSNNYGKGFIVAKTSDNEYGFIINSAGSGSTSTRNINRSVLTEGIQNSNVTSQNFVGSATSVNLIQLTDIISPDDDIIFDGAYNVFITPSTANGKVLINDKHYYICLPAGFALEYNTD